MSLRGFFTTTATVYHRDTDTVSDTHETTPAFEEDGTDVLFHYEEGMPSWDQQSWGLQVDVDATIYCEPGTDIRPDDDVTDPRPDKVVIGSRSYLAMGVREYGIAGHAKLMAVALRRMVA